MKDVLIADLWGVIVEHIPEKHRKDVAADFINTLLDYGIKDSVLESLMGVDPYLDTAIEYSIDRDEVDNYDDEDYLDDDED
jgi:hypothetical protein